MDAFSKIAYAELVRDVQDARGNTGLMARAVQRLRRFVRHLEVRDGVERQV